uniref:Calcineurin-like phosphoesterase domain-containing protein n=1 Tax=Fagus sylvatica TaxID=28930 RepID=A0A2N9EJQ5_FAGSY
MVMMFIPSCPSVSQKPMNLSYLSKHIALSKYKRDIKRGSIERPQILPSTSGDAVGLRVFVLSDLHTDYADNMKWVKSISTVTHKKDVLLVAGDVAELYDNFVLTMSLLKDRFEHIFYIPGNHDLWCRLDGEDYVDSLQKLNKLLDACRVLGVETNPMIVDGLGIIPLFSWYHESFDREKDITGVRITSLEMVIHFSSC